MHASVLAFVPTALTAADVAGKRVVEAGSYNVNGSVRPYIESLGPVSYVGIDMREGPGVGEVCAAEDLPPGCADVLVSTEMLEHARDWQAAVAGMVHALAPGGLLLLTTRSRGFPLHCHPEDHWRFSTEAMGAILNACGLDVERLELDPEAPGVFALARKPAGWAGIRGGLDPAWAEPPA